MRRTVTSLLFCAGIVAGMPAAFAAAGTLSFVADPPIVQLQDRVTYSTAGTPALITYVGYNIAGFGNTGSNTINNVRVSFTASVTDPQEKLTLYRPEFYLPGFCTWDKDSSGNPIPANPVVIHCDLSQMKAGSSFPSFPIFYRTPAKVTGGDGAGDADGSDVVTLAYTIVYAEGVNDQPNSVPQNSVIETSNDRVTLGTMNPVDIRTGLPQGDSARTIFTGDKGIPKANVVSPTLQLLAFTELVTVPKLSSYTVNYLTSSILITEASQDAIDNANCINGGNFASCPNYATTLLAPGGSEFDFGVAAPVLFTYRIDASNLKRPPSQILNSTTILYTGGPFVDEPVQACTNGMPNSNGLPCVYDKFCYKNNYSVVDLRGDCEWQLLNTKNGFTKIR